MSAHAPAPWTLHEVPATKYRLRELLIEGADFPEEAGIIGKLNVSHPAADANAALMIAAPDLLEAAEALERAEDFNANDCDECEGDGTAPELCPKCFPLFDDARVKRRAAIAKAKVRP